MKKLIFTTALVLLATLNALAQAPQTSNQSGETTDKIIYEKADTMPQFPGGEEKMWEFLFQNLKYPEMGGCFEGRVIARFIVSETGKIEAVEIVKSPHPSLGNEVIKVVQLMPKWSPGKLNGKAVPVYYTLPVVFRLE